MLHVIRLSLLVLGNGSFQARKSWFPEFLEFLFFALQIPNSLFPGVEVKNLRDLKAKLTSRADFHLAFSGMTQ